MREVARRYLFRGVHHVPELPAPWCCRHEHWYTVEVVARGEGAIVVDTYLIDMVWAYIAAYDSDRNLHFSSGKSLAARWLAEFRADVPAVVRVVVWEDNARWGAAEA